MNNVNKVDVLKKISPQMVEVIRFQEENSGNAFDTSGLSCAQIRDNYVKERRFWNEGGPTMAKSLEVKIPYNNYSILTRIHYPNTSSNSAVIFFIHGGGFTVGSIDTHDRIMRIIAISSNCVVVGINYSLAPEAKFPIAIHECAEVTSYYRKNASKFDINPDKIAFAGDSCGATLSLGTYLWLRDNEDDTSYVKSLLLYYGLFGLKDSVSRRLYGGNWDGLTEEDFKFYYEMYLEKPEDMNSKYCCFFNNDLTKRMPPCFIATCEFDPLIDDSRTLYEILKENNIPSEYKMYPGTLHAFLHYSKMMQASYDALEDGANFLKNIFSI